MDDYTLNYREGERAQIRRRLALRAERQQQSKAKWRHLLRRLRLSWLAAVGLRRLPPVLPYVAGNEIRYPSWPCTPPCRNPGPVELGAPLPELPDHLLAWPGKERGLPKPAPIVFREA